MLKVRKGTIEEIIKVNRSIKEFDRHFSKKYFEDRLQGKDSLVCLALVDDTPAGFAICWTDTLNNWVYIWALAVTKKYRKQGVMRAMISFEEDWARKKGFHRIKSNVNNGRKEMLIANIKLGYSITGVELHENIDKCRVFFEKSI